MAATKGGGIVLVVVALLMQLRVGHNAAPGPPNPYDRFALSITNSARVHAVCLMVPSPKAPYNVTGTVDFMQSVTSLNYPLGQLGVKVQLQGFPINDAVVDHGLHVHMFGDFSNGCDSAGGHYNPLNSVHGDRNSPVRHVGDFGNVREDTQGRIVAHFKDKMASLVGDHSIIGRGLVIHEKPDDMGQGGNEASLSNGNSGSRLACCVIAFANGNRWSDI